MSVEQPAPRIATLVGSAHPDLGSVAVATIDARTAVGLSAGREPKPYWHLDPNEDAVLAATDGQAVLLAVADGHNGIDIAQAALILLERRAVDLLAVPPRRAEEALTAALMDVEAGVQRTLGELRDPRDRSRAALTVAVATDGRLVTATYGDTALVRVRAGRARVVGGTAAFLGARGALPAHATARLRAGDRLVACSDGVTDHLGPHWAEELARLASTAEDAEDAVRATLARAFAGDAGDHCAVAVTTIA